MRGSVFAHLGCSTLVAVALAPASCSDDSSGVAGQVNLEPTYIGAAFWGLPAPRVACTEVLVGACRVAQCRSQSAEELLESLEEPPPSWHTGRLTITNGDRRVVVVHSVGASYVPPEGGAIETLFQGGEVLTVHGEGGDVPSFAGSVRAPTNVVVTAPSAVNGLDPVGNLRLERGRDLTFDWTGGGEGAVVSVRGGHFDEGANDLVDCRFDAASLEGTVPAAALDTLPTGARLSVSVASQSTAQQGSFKVTLLALGRAVDESGGRYPGVTLVRD
jgi:hypothetical protein